MWATLLGTDKEVDNIALLVMMVAGAHLMYLCCACDLAVLVLERIVHCWEAGVFCPSICWLLCH